MITAAFQGAHGAFSELAAQSYFEEVRCLPFPDFESATRAVAEGIAQYAVIPVENSIAGPIPANQALVQLPAFQIVGEVWVPIHHMLMALPGTSVDALRNILSHPVALAQCNNFFAQHPHAHPIAWYDTAGAAQFVSRKGDVALGAIAARAAAVHYSLEILVENVEDRPDNQTHFCIIRLA